MADPYIGEIRMFGGNFAIRQYALCDGQLLPISQNQALFSILGCTYGGDCRTTLGLPDFRGRVPVHSGDGPGLSSYQLGEKGGVELNTMTIAQMPSHSHTAAAGSGQGGATLKTTTPVNSQPATSTTPSTNNDSVLGVAATEGAKGAPVKMYNTEAPEHTLKPGEAALGISIGNTGGSQSMENRQPFLAVNFLIAIQGLFPPRN